MSRLRLAYLLAPIIPSLFFAFALQLSDLKWLIVMLVFSIPFSYLPCLLFGVPYISFLRKKEKLNMMNLAIGAALLGMLVFYIFGFVFSETLGSSKSIVPSIKELLSGALIGVSIAVPFSLIAGFPVLNTQNNKMT